MYQVALGLQTLRRAEAVATLARLRAQEGGCEVRAETPQSGCHRPGALRWTAPPAARHAWPRAALARLITARLGDCMLRNPNEGVGELGKGAVGGVCTTYLRYEHF